MEHCQLFKRILLCNQQAGLPLTRNRINRFLSLCIIRDSHLLSRLYHC